MNLIPKQFYLDDIFDNFLLGKDSNNLKCDIYEKDNHYYIEMDAPGMKKEDIVIGCDSGYLTISISQTSEKEDKTKKYIRKERVSKEYHREFYIGDIDFDKIKAEFKDGFLKIVIPKEEIEKPKKQITIE